ncbi:thymidine phosphorylase [candidate division KSB3 bacterium]|uniref:Thymidine phosphorylase n=1 Tax=candidate division KSB3 bacterium TaxID=2044937 RepID=A0A2G6E809_9BACT|nr:MAG: thymidine phosphorylase [candidate division KSB3 bacterium]PIE30510.1 MAG: thymidine phosphorylase [candidate division KSB3 bacterium]
MRPQDIIKKKRDGIALTHAEIQYMVDGYINSRIPNYQMAAFTMAMFFQGATKAETVALTESMLHSGTVVDLALLPGKKVDKHSTGGVGDKISIPLAPAAAAAGIYVPMISGRGLGHTGGTLDKLESIPGFQVNIPLDRYVEILKAIGVCMLGQTSDIAPADKKIYALRDVTATIESVPLITASILSKKLAEGIDGLVFDVKVGNGAFMKTEADATILAKNLVSIASMMGKDVVALITDMNEPLGFCIGNTLEILESLEVLQGRGPEDVVKLTVELGAYMLKVGKVAETIDAGRQKMRQVLSDGSALRRFRQLVQLQGGDISVIDNPETFKRAEYTQEIRAQSNGYISSMHSENIGTAAMLLGAGRDNMASQIDHAAGIILKKKVGDRVTRGDTLCVLEYNDHSRLEDAVRTIQESYTIGSVQPKARPLIRKVVTGSPE